MHEEDVFGPEEFNEFKSSQDRGTPLTESEYQEQLASIKARLLQCLIDYEEEFLDEIGSSSDIVGLVLCGSWANKNPHTKSDIDLYILCTAEIEQAWEEFAKYLRQHGLPTATIFGWYNITDKESMKIHFKSDRSPFKDSSYILINSGQYDLEAIINAL